MILKFILILLFKRINSISIPSLVNNTDVKLRIVNGYESEISRFPFMVSVFTETKPNWGDYCGGSILNNRWILTASHCVLIDGKLAKPENVNIRIGINSLDEKESWQFKNHKANQVISHPQYNSENFYNDVALIEIKDPIEYSDEVKPTCIDYNKTKEYSLLIAAGYGSITHRYKIDGKLNTDNDGNKLKYAYFKETRKDCLNNDMFICIYSYYDNGDSVKSNIIGVFSNLPGIKVDENKYEYCEGHAKYTRLANHFDFINKHVGTDYCWLN